MQLQPQTELEQSLEQDNRHAYLRQIAKQIDEEEQSKNMHLFLQNSQNKKGVKQQGQFDDRESYIQCEDGMQIIINYQNNNNNSKTKTNTTQISKSTQNRLNKGESKEIYRSQQTKKSISKPKQPKILNSIIQNDSQNKKSDEEPNSQLQQVLQSKIIKVYSIQNMDELARNHKQPSHKSKNSFKKNEKEQDFNINLNQSIYIQNIQNSFQIPPKQAQKYKKGQSKEKRELSKDKGGKKSLDVMQSMTTASKLILKGIQQKNEDEAIQNDQYLQMFKRLTKLQKDISLIKERKMSKSSKKLNPSSRPSISKLLNNELVPIAQKQSNTFSFHNESLKGTSDLMNYSDDVLRSIANQQIWRQFIEISKNKTRLSNLQNCCKRIAKLLNIRHQFQIIDQQTFYVLFGNNRILYVTYSQKVYFGEFIRKSGAFFKEGLGLEIDRRKSIYRGFFVNGLRDGHGKFIALGKYKYQGQWKQGVIEGKGKLHEESGGIYVGRFINGKKQGYGTQILYNGDKYEGQYRNDLFHGKGIYIWKSGSQYVGDFVFNKMHGIGRLTSNKGTVFEGNFLNGLKDTKGTSHKKDPRFSERRIIRDSYRYSSVSKKQGGQQESPIKYTIYLNK